MPDIARYLQRISFLLRQGKPVNDVAVYLPTDDATRGSRRGGSQWIDGHGGLLGPNVVPQVLDAGYNFDFIDDGAIAQVGSSLPHSDSAGCGADSLGDASENRGVRRAGGKVVATRRTPSLAPGLAEAESETAQIRELARALFEAPARAASS